MFSLEGKSRPKSSEQTRWPWLGGDRHLSQAYVTQGFESAFFEVAGVLWGPGCIFHPHMSYRLMQRKFSEPNTYIDGLPSRDCQDDLYDDVEVSELIAVVSTWTGDGVGGEGV